jgi:hypothetical protein
MTQWEYCSLLVLDKGDRQEIWQHKPGADRQQLPAGTVLLPLANELGADGWELVSTIPLSQTADLAAFDMYFKRPKA